MRQTSFWTLALCATAIACAAHPGFAQDGSPLVVSQAPLAVVAKPLSAPPNAALPQNTEVLLSFNDTLTTKGKRWQEGDNFNLSVVRDVTLSGRVVIPRGTLAVGRVSWLTGKGMFGKSGKMEIDLEYIDLDGLRVPITGNYRQEGQGNAAATVGGVVVAGVLAGVITGKSGQIPKGMQIIGRTKDKLPVNLESLPMTTQEKQRQAAAKAKPSLSNGTRRARVICVTCSQ